MKSYGCLIAVISLILVFVFQSSVNAADLYADYQELAAANIEGGDYKIVSRKNYSDLAIIAIHGGGIEPGTTELADHIAGSNYNYYSFNGIMSNNNISLHITSTNFDEPIALDLVQHINRTLSIHGFSGSSKLTYVGGLDQTMVNNVKKSLEEAGFIVAAPPSQYGATSASNICNKNLKKAGVQIELSTALRASFFSSLTALGRQTKTTEFYKYASAINKALSTTPIVQQTKTTEDTSVQNEASSNTSTVQQTKTTEGANALDEASNNTSTVHQTKTTEGASAIDDASSNIQTGQQKMTIETYKYMNALYIVIMLLVWSPEFFQLTNIRREISGSKSNLL